MDRAGVARWIGAIVLLAQVPAASATTSLRAEGLSFPSPIPALGEALELVGRLDPAVSEVPFPLDPGLDYTWSVYGPVVHAVSEPVPGISDRDLTFGVLEVRADPVWNASYPPFPPNSVVPSTFHDGQVLLLGALTGLRIREAFGIVTASGTVQFESGAALASLGALTTWTFGAAVSPFGTDIPAGFGSHWSLQLAPLAPVGVEGASWGRIKLLYR